MDSINGKDVTSQQLRPESQSIFAQGISQVLYRWSTLQMAIQKEWGGRDSRQKSEQLAVDLFSWFSQSKVLLYVDDLENMLDESMMLSFNTEIEDGSIEEVAEELMIMYEDCLQGNYESIEKLRKSNSGAGALSQSRRVLNEDDDKNSVNKTTLMVADHPKPRLNPMPRDLSLNDQKTR